MRPTSQLPGKRWRHCPEEKRRRKARHPERSEGSQDQSVYQLEILRRLRDSEAVKISRVARLASATMPDARRADESMRGHRRGGATKQMASSGRKTGHSGYFHSLSG